MCGINGIVYFNGPCNGLQEKIRTMQETTGHRGPDKNDSYVMERASLGTNMLRIVAPNDFTSIASTGIDNNFVAFNGEISNYRALRNRISTTPFNHTDTSLILPLFREYGTDYVNQLAGMFAIAIYDRQHNRLQLWRDPLGIKPLYYHASKDGVIFSSEIKAIYAVMDNPPDIDFAAVDHILRHRFHPGDSTVFPGIYKVLPGETIVFENGRVTKKRYWTLGDNSETLDQKVSIEGFRGLLEQVINENTQADANGGFFTSGGLDSSLLTSIALRFRSSPYRQPISLKFSPQPVADEEYAKMLENYLGVKFEWVEISDSAARQTLTELVHFLDEPLENPTHVGTYLMAKRARELGIKSVVTGDGSDEFFLGYERHACWFTNPNPAAVYPSLCWTLKPNEAEELYLAHAKEATRPIIDGYGREMEPVLDMRTALRFERWERLTQYHNMRLDRMTMAHGVEAKVPFQDHRIVEYSLRIPPSILIGKSRKEWLQEAAKPYLPHELIYRDKVLFPSLPDQWLSGEGSKWVAEILLDRGARIHEWMKPEVLEKYVREHADKTHPRGKQLWALTTLELWKRQLPNWRKVYLGKS